MKRLIRDRYKDVEDEFKRLDRSSYGELTPELLFHLFQRFVLLTLFSQIISFQIQVYPLSPKSILVKSMSFGRIVI